MTDLFREAGIDPTKRAQAGDKRKAPQQAPRGQQEGDDTFGGHNLRQVLSGKTLADGTLVIPRPRSKLASSSSQEFLRDFATDTIRGTMKNPEEEEYDEDEEEYENEEDAYGEENYAEEDEETTATPRRKGARTNDPPPPPHNASTITPTAHVTTSTTQVSQPFPLTTVSPNSTLGRAAAALFSTTGFQLARELIWQSAVAGDTTKIKSFRQEVTQQVDMTAFGFMRPSSPYVQILHSIATYAVRGGASSMHNADFGFIGDRTDFKVPTPVAVDEKMWKWVTKKLGLDVPPLEAYYSTPGNEKLLYHDDASGGETTCVPRMLYLPPPFLVYCLEKQRTPFELHQFVAAYAVRDGAEVTIKQCEPVMDWCFRAAHRAAANTPTTSMLAISMEAAPSDDDDFLRWLYKVDCTNGDGPTVPSFAAGASGPTASAKTAGTTTQRLAPLATPTTTTTLPAPDVWERMATSISNSFASAAAALKPPPMEHGGDSYEVGGLPYDKFQMAALQGFSHAPDITGVPVIWALFQYTKNLDTHKDNIKRRMLAWATDPARPMQVPIDRSLYFPNSTLKEILTLNFNPGGILAEADAADLGMSILICRARTTAAKTAIRKHERALEQSRRSRSMAEAEAEENKRPAYDSGALPDDYHELLRCVGTYCALLHALFGDRCGFYRQCYALWLEMNSDLVNEQRQDFSALYCRQIVWAVLLESRIYFSQRLSIDDFTNVHPDDIKFPRCNLHKVVAQVRDMEPIVRSSFPAAWYPAGAGRGNSTVTAGVTSTQGTPTGTVAPVQSISAQTGGAPSVVSGITANTTRSPRPQVTIRTTDIHPTIKTTMDPYIAKNKGVWLGAMLTHVNLTMDDLPRLPPEVSGTGTICYNYILGHCKMEGCHHEHVRVRDLTDEFVTDLLSKLRPSIAEFTTNGLPPGTRRRRRPRRGRA